MAKKYLSPKIREFIAERAQNLCEYCQCRSDCACESFEGEHIFPVSKGGSSEAENLAFTCRGCNSRKSDRTVAKDILTKQLVPLFNPRSDHWNDHFAWTEDFIQIIGLTPKGRVTVDALQLN